MIELLGFAQLLALVWLGFSLLVALILTWSLTRFLLPRLERLSADRRSQSLWAISGAPGLAGLLLCGLCLLPSILSIAWPLLDHCLDHGAHHAHLCLIHGWSAPLRMVWLLPPLLALVIMGRRLVPWLRNHARAWMALRSLERTAAFDAKAGVYLLDVDTSWAFVGGVARQRIFISRGLVEQLSPRELGLVLAHERAHVRRRDNLRRLTAALLSFFYLPSTRRLLLSELELACEQASDVLAAPSELERLHMAQVLLRLSRMMTRSSPIECAISGAAGHLEPRILALVNASQEPTHAPPRRANVWWFLSACALAFILAEPLHHATETLWGFLLG